MRALVSLIVGRSSRHGSRAWVTLAALTWAGRQARRMMANEEKVVFSERMKPGERLVITNINQPKQR